MLKDARKIKLLQEALSHAMDELYRIEELHQNIVNFQELACIENVISENNLLKK